MGMQQHSKIYSFSDVLDDYRQLLEINAKRSNANKEKEGIKFALKITTSNLNELYKEDIKSGIGFDIDTSVSYNIKTLVDIDSMVDSMGIYSYLFGPRDDDPKSVEQKRFACGCGKTIGPRSGIICPHCKGETTLVEKIRGWIKLKYRIFNPYWFDVFLKHLRKLDIKDKDKQKPSIFKAKKESKSLKQIIISNLNNFRIRKSEENRWTLLDLQDDKSLEAFIKYYVQEEYIEKFLKHIGNAMTYYIPVLSKNFRHFSLNNKLDGSQNMQTHPINKCYIEISSLADQINATGIEYSSSKDILKKLSTISDNFNEIKEKIYLELLDDKESLIRSVLFGGRMPNSGRFIVSGLTDNPRLDVFTMGYKSFGEITQNDYMDLYIKHGATPENLARMRENIPIQEDKDIMDKVLADMIENNWAYFLLYRAPNIYFGSQISLKCIGLTEEDVIRINDITLDGNFKGDKDGDSVGIFTLHRDIALSIFLALNPYRITFNPIRGEISPKHSLIEGGYMTLFLAMRGKADITEVELDGEKESA